MSIIKMYSKDNLKVKIMDSREAMGEVAGQDIADKIIELQKEKDELNIIFAAAPSQNEVLEKLISVKNINWSKINGFHMDEYLGLKSTAPQGFGNFLRQRLFEKVNFKNIYCINGCAGNIDEECARYTVLIKEHPIDIVCLGIGENGHIAFNDPYVADFNDEKVIKTVLLDDICRNQQVNDECFEKVEDVPKAALTLTMPTLFSGDYLFCSVPAFTKANAVRAMLNDEISERCPATMLRKHSNAILYCDPDSSSKL